MDDHAAYQKVMERFTDVQWRLNNLYYILDKSGQRTLFEMNWAQGALFHEMHYLNLILKARQLGFTTFIQLFMLDACIFNSNIRAATVAHTLPSAQSIFADKVKYPYENLPEGLRATVMARADSANELAFSNNSSLRVATSLRSGTLQYLHVSEHGKICAKYPEKAQEVRTGALNTVDAGQMIFIESTAEGQDGDFYDMCQRSQSLARMDVPLTALDFKFMFFPWWKHPDYVLDPIGVVITDEFAEYFAKLRDEHGIELTAEQQAWYVKKAETQQDDMKREFPSTPKEAFEASLEGAYYSRQIAAAEKQGRIGKVPYDDSQPVHTIWDIGRDTTAIWFAQFIGPHIRVIDYYENDEEGLPFYVGVLNDKGYIYGHHWGPHDLRHGEWGAAATRLQSARKLGIRFKIAPEVSIEDGINAVRVMFARCWFDEAKCADGLKGLRAYRKEWDTERATWKSQPRHDWASHPADGFRYLCLSYRDHMGEQIDRSPRFERTVGETLHDHLKAAASDRGSRITTG